MPISFTSGFNTAHSTNEAQEISNIKNSVTRNNNFGFTKNARKNKFELSSDRYEKTTSEEVKKQCFLRGALSFFLPGINDLVEDRNILKFVGLTGLSIVTGLFSPLIAFGIRSYSAISTAFKTKKRAQEQYEIIESPKQDKKAEKTAQNENIEAKEPQNEQSSEAQQPQSEQTNEAPRQNENNEQVELTPEMIEQLKQENVLTAHQG